MKEYNVTLNELVFRLISLYRAAHKVTDNIPSQRLIKDWIHSTRAMLLKQKFDKPFAYIDDQLTQTLKEKVGESEMPLRLEEVDTSQFHLFPSDRKILRTVSKIPPPINRKGMIGAFTRIGPIDRMDMKFKPVSYDTALVSGNGKFNKKDVYAFTLDGHIYLVSKVMPTLALLDVRGVFQNPEQVLGFTDESPYPINRELVDDLERIIVQTKLQTTLVGYKDTIADDTDNLVQTTGQQQRKE